MNNQNTKRIDSPKRSPKSIMTVLGNFLRRDKLTYKSNATEVTMPAKQTNPRIVQLDAVLNRSRLIWERTASNNN